MYLFIIQIIEAVYVAGPDLKWIMSTIKKAINHQQNKGKVKCFYIYKSLSYPLQLTVSFFMNTIYFHIRSLKLLKIKNLSALKNIELLTICFSCFIG